MKRSTTKKPPRAGRQLTSGSDAKRPRIFPREIDAVFQRTYAGKVHRIADADLRLALEWAIGQMTADQKKRLFWKCMEEAYDTASQKSEHLEASPAVAK